jgi:endonuclease G
MPIDVDAFRQLVADTKEDRQKVRDFAARGNALDAEPIEERAADYASRLIAHNLAGPEALQGPTNDIQAIWFMVRGAATRRAVGFVEVSRPGANDRGTGFLISPNLFITNQHVIPDIETAKTTRIVFDNERDENGLPAPQTIFTLAPGRFALFSDQSELDYALIALGPRVFGNATAAELGYCILSDRPDKHAIGMPVNIIEHPSGMPKMVALRNNRLVARTTRTLLYETDTENGSSGSPVYNDLWEVVALHHYGEPFLEKIDDTGKAIPTKVNEGVRISAIYADLSNKLQTLGDTQKTLLATALAYDKAQPDGLVSGHRLTPPQPDAAEKFTTSALDRTMSDDGRALTISVPLEISIRLGGPASTVAVAAPAAAPVKTLAMPSGGAEVLHIDEEYSNRGGYDSKFIAGVEIPLPQPNDTLAKQIAPLKSNQPHASQGILKYEHFSVVLSKTHKMAIFTATNIDGDAYLTVKRETGKVTDAAEGDKWFIDPRTDESNYLGLPFYADWSDYFDRGHLTRRTDPTWGTDEEAERANADTFHLTNCSPQHFRFNESAKYWQGAERFVLENGVLVSDTKPHITVFQGPVFNSKIDMRADKTQIPSSFFKVIVWKGEDGLKSVGLLVDQGPLLSESRKSLGQPKALPSVNVTQWRVPIKTIEQRAGLSFGDVVTAADTIKDKDQPAVGEAIVAVTTADDILPARVRRKTVPTQ